MPRPTISLDHVWSTLVLSTSQEASLLSQDNHIPIRLLGVKHDPKINAGALLRQDGGDFHVSFPKTPIPSVVAFRSPNSPVKDRASATLRRCRFPRLMC
jgi:hypothetical protein